MTASNIEGFHTAAAQEDRHGTHYHDRYRCRVFPASSESLSLVGPTGGKLRYPAISSKALPHTTLETGVKHWEFFLLCPEPALQSLESQSLFAPFWLIKKEVVFDQMSG
jgi:hypothetical protein